MINTLFNIGQSALNASQAWINVTGNNIANADTEGYSRQYVTQSDAGGLKYSPGAQPLGVSVQSVMRFFDAFLERSYTKQNTNSSRWDQQDTIMASLENIFNEANRTGISSSLTNFFNAWQDLALRPDDTSTRVSLLSYADNLSDMFRNTTDAIKTIQQEMNVSIQSDVNRVNEIAKAIADLNNQITAQTIDGVNYPNSLLDERDQLVRELSGIIDVETIDKGSGDFRVQLTTGQPLVDGVVSYELAFLGPQATENHLVTGSSYTGTVNYSGTDNFEYTIDIIKAESKDPTTGELIPAEFRVSIDGGKSWLKDDNNEELHIKIEDTNDIAVKNLTISFTEVEGFTVGDQFNIMPKSGLYWIEPTRGPENITPQIYMNGTDNTNRVTGGTLAAYFNIRDDNCGRYLDELNAVASSLIWEVNRIHSQGTGLTNLTDVTGSEKVGNTTAALGTPQAQLANYDKLQAGSVIFYSYDKNTGDYNESFTLDFDPATMSLENVKDEINKSGFLTADIQDGKLIIKSTDANNVEYAMGADSTGLMAALGINTFFSGSNASDIAVNSAVHSNSNLVASGQVNGQYQINVGDNATATAIGKLIDKAVTISTAWKTVENQTISQYYANLVSTVGADRRTSKTNSEYHTALTSDLYDRVESVKGVNMDEEMANLIKFQHSYTAAAKLITTADEMLQTLLGLKQ